MTTHSLPARNVFGREPAAITGVVSAFLTLGISFGLDIDTEVQGYIIAAVEAVLGLIVVLQVKENVYPALITLVRVAIPLVVSLGLSLTVDQQGALLAFVTILLTFFGTRPQVTAKANVIDARQTGETTFDATNSPSQGV